MASCAARSNQRGGDPSLGDGHFSRRLPLQAHSGSCSLLRVSTTDDVSDLERAFLLTQRDGRVFAPFGLAAEGASERWGAERSIRASVVRAAAIGEKGWSVT